MSNDPKRWSSSGSDVDPVLRSVLRYARDVAPTPSEARALLQRVQGAEAASPSEAAIHRPRRWNRARPTFLTAALALALACGGVAWAGYALHVAREARATSVATTAEPMLGARSRHIAVIPSALAPPLSASAEVIPPVVPTPASSARSVAAQVTSSADSAALDDAELLQAARRVVASNPSRALTLTQDHALRFPQSPLTEERKALQIEALVRLGRVTRARNALDAFQLAYPRSPYRRRLQALIGP